MNPKVITCLVILAATTMVSDYQLSKFVTINFDHLPLIYLGCREHSLLSTQAMLKALLL